MMDQLEAIINRAADIDSLWWPFLSLRPKQTERFSYWRVVLFGLIVTIVVPALIIPIRIAMNRTLLFEWVLFPAIFVFASLFFGTAAYFWNRRAGRLVRGENFDASSLRTR